MQAALILIFAAVALGLWTPSAQAQKATPGLWEHTITMKGGRMDAAMAQMQERLARMPPEQRKQFETMMASQGMGMVAGKPTTMRVCVTPEQAARDEVPLSQGDCTQTSRERNGRTMRIKFTCQGQRKGSGEAEFTFESDKAHSGRMLINSVEDGKPVRMDIEHSGRWISANCGDVKPRP
jgi:Protein of unknown function (DUF3617)